MDQSAEHPVVKEGLLVKQGHFRKNWKTRYFALGNDGLLSYWEYDRVSIALCHRVSGKSSCTHIQHVTQIIRQ